MKRQLATCLALVLAGGLFTACAGTAETGVQKIGVVQLVEHQALDAAYRGFVDGLAEAGYKDGENIRLDYQNAQGEQANCNTIASKFVNDRSDLILAIATPAAQAAANATSEIPILVTAVTDPASAKLVASNDSPGGNVTGTSDLTPCAEQMQLLKKLVPTARRVGMLYTSSEVNSAFQVKIAAEAAEQLGLKVQEFTVSSSNEVQQVVESMLGKVDVIYCPTDNTMATSMTTIASIAAQQKIPVIVGEENVVDKGGLATYGIDYYELGRQTAAQAVRILKGESPANMPIEYQSNPALKINREMADRLGIAIPDDLQP